MALGAVLGNPDVLHKSRETRAQSRKRGGSIKLKKTRKLRYKNKSKTYKLMSR
jgi:hypothetical protein